MNLRRRLFAFFLVVFALAAAGAASAMTISQVRGAVLLGRPLDVSVQIAYSPEEDATGGCYFAEVFYGEVPQPAGRVTVTAEPLRDAKTTRLRIVSATRLDEPTATITVSVGCNQRVTRTFQMLSDMLTQPSEGTAAPSSTGSAQFADKTAPERAKTSSSPVAAVEGDKPMVTVGSVASNVPSKPRKAVGKESSRLVIDPKGQASSKADGSKLRQQMDDLEQRLDTQIQNKFEGVQANLAQNDAKLKALASDLKGLQVLTAKNQQNIELMAQTLEKTTSSANLNLLIYGLAALVLAAVAGVAYLAWGTKGKSNRTTTWWGGSADTSLNTVEKSPAASDEPLSSEALTAQSARPTAAGVPAAKSIPDKVAAPAAKAPPPVATAVDPEEDIDLAIDLAALESQALSSAHAPLPSIPLEPQIPEKQDFAHSGAAALRAINTKEMLDIRQQAEFFMALGQHQEAIELLHKSITENDQANPLVYLDLLKVLHTLGRKQEFDRYAQEFNVQFTGRVPEFSGFNQEGTSLDAYSEICDQIVELWPQEDALDYIEHCLVRVPEDDPDSGFDLEAFRDLLMLHGVLRRLLDTLAGSDMVPFSATRSPNSSLGDLPTPAAVTAATGATSVEIDLPVDAAADHEHLDFTDPLPSIGLPQTGAGKVQDVPVVEAPPEIAPTAYSDLLLAPKSDNLIDFDITGLDTPSQKTPKG